MKREMRPETVLHYVSAAGFKPRRGYPSFLRRGMMGSHIFLVDVWDDVQGVWVPCVFKYHHDRHSIEREAAQYRLLKGAIADALVSHRSSGRDRFLLVDFVPNVENLADLLRAGDPQRFDDMQRAVRTTLQFMTYAWTAFGHGIVSPSGVPTVYRSTLQAQRRWIPFGNLGYALKRMLGKLRGLPIVVNGRRLTFTAMDALEEIHRVFFDRRCLTRERLTHGDLNPGNILVAKGGGVHLIDCRAVRRDEFGEDWVRDLAYLAGARSTLTVRVYEGEPPPVDANYLVLNYTATFASVADTIFQLCHAYGGEVAQRQELCDPGWERRFLLHRAAAYLSEMFYLERRFRWGVIPPLPHLATFCLGEAFLAVEKARALGKSK